jgi:hypothetical protein
MQATVNAIAISNPFGVNDRFASFYSKSSRSCFGWAVQPGAAVLKGMEGLNQRLSYLLENIRAAVLDPAEFYSQAGVVLWIQSLQDKSLWRKRSPIGCWAIAYTIILEAPLHSRGSLYEAAHYRRVLLAKRNAPQNVGNDWDRCYFTLNWYYLGQLIITIVFRTRSFKFNP